jgi:hypothetical protein
MLGLLIPLFTSLLMLFVVDRLAQPELGEIRKQIIQRHHTTLANLLYKTRANDTLQVRNLTLGRTSGSLSSNYSMQRVYGYCKRHMLT